MLTARRQRLSAMALGSAVVLAILVGFLLTRGDDSPKSRVAGTATPKASVAAGCVPGAQSGGPRDPGRHAISNGRNPVTTGSRLFSPDCRRYATLVNTVGGQVDIFRADGSRLREISFTAGGDPDNDVKVLAWAPDSQRVAAVFASDTEAGKPDDYANVLDLRSPSSVVTHPVARSGRPELVWFSEDGRRLIGSNGYESDPL